jgi:hypothetical protein
MHEKLSSIAISVFDTYVLFVICLLLSDMFFSAGVLFFVVVVWKYCII